MTEWRADIHALSGAYAVDAVDEAERAMFEAHLADCADCQEEVASLRAAAATLTEEPEHQTAPPPRLRGDVLAQISQVRPLPPATAPTRTGPGGVDRTTGATVHEHPARRRRWPLLVAAAAVAAILGIGGGVVAWAPWDDEPATTQPVPMADQVRRAPDATVHVAEMEGGARATIYRSMSMKAAVVVTEKMPPTPQGMAYELWLQDDSGRMEPAGMIPHGSSQTVVLEGDASTATAVGITMEPAGGSRQPTSDPLAVVPLEQT